MVESPYASDPSDELAEDPRTAEGSGSADEAPDAPPADARGTEPDPDGDPDIPSGLAEDAEPPGVPDGPVTSEGDPAPSG